MKKKEWRLIVGVLVVVASIVGVSYAAWVLEFKQASPSNIASSCFSVTFTEDTDSISLTDAYPMVDADGKKLTPYTFTITNKCEAYASYQVNLEVLNSSTLTNHGFLKVMLDSKTPSLLSSNEVVSTTLNNATTSYKLGTYYLDSKQSKTHNVRLWLDENVEMGDGVNNQTFDSMITISATYSPTIPSDYELCVNDYGADSFQCSIMASVDTSGKCPTVNDDGTVSVTSSEKTNALVCSAPDDYGTSYYYRGTVENNWVKFGGYYWRILRINGDDSIRMIYAGDASVIDALDATTKATVLSNGYDDSTTLYTQIGTSAYNYYWKKDNVQEIVNSYVYGDNAGVGYMYGNRDGVTEGTTEYKTSSWTSTNTYYVSEEYSYDVTTGKFTLKNPIAVLASEMTSDYIGYYTHGQTSSSTSYNYIYKITSVSVGESSTKVGYSYVKYGTTSKEQAQTNINDSTIKAYLDNWYTTNLANYETYISDTLFCNDRTIQATIPSGYSNLGYGVEITAYRWYNSSNGKKLTCQEQNDRFTVNDEVNGNGDLTHPIGLITTDEVYLAGGSASSNHMYYLYTGNRYWTMSPSHFNGNDAYVKDVTPNGIASRYSVQDSHGVRPTINLKSGTLTKGSGSASDPWMVE